MFKFTYIASRIERRIYSSSCDPLFITEFGQPLDRNYFIGKLKHVLQLQRLTVTSKSLAFLTVNSPHLKKPKNATVYVVSIKQSTKLLKTPFRNL
jgi:hypothetical protein